MTVGGSEGAEGLGVAAWASRVPPVEGSSGALLLARPPAVGVEREPLGGLSILAAEDAMSSSREVAASSLCINVVNGLSRGTVMGEVML